MARSEPHSGPERKTKRTVLAKASLLWREAFSYSLPMNISRKILHPLRLVLLLTLAGATALLAATALPTSVRGIKVYDAKQFREAGWKIARPPYPYAAMKAHEQGTVYVQLTTDSSGRIVTAITAITAKKTVHPQLDASLVEWTKSNGHGPPNAMAITFFIFHLG